jgi:MFS family permease
VILMVTMGVRQSSGLFMSPINTSTGLGVVSLSFALAIGQFVWGAVQPVAGAVADRYGPGRVLAAGLVVLALGCALTPFMDSTTGMVIALGLLSAAGSGAGSFSVLIGAVSRKLDSAKRGQAAGMINAGGSLGQFVFAPLAQKLITSVGWMGAMYALAIAALAALPLARALRAREPVISHAAAGRQRRPAPRGARRAARPQLPAAARGLLHLRLPHRLPGDAPAGRGRSVRPAGRSGERSLALIGLANIAAACWPAGRWAAGAAR